MYKFKINNSKDENYFTQINNKRSPTVACFSTSMINASISVNTIFPKNANSKYTDIDDQYDEFIYSDEMVEYYKKHGDRDTKWALSKGYQLREVWSIQVTAFNKWVGYKACEMVIGLSKEKFIEHIFLGGTMVIGGIFCGFGHMVSACGYTGTDDSDRKNVSKVVDCIIDDPFGNPLKNYDPRGKFGNDVHYPFTPLWNILHKSHPKKDEILAILFYPDRHITKPKV